MRVTHVITRLIVGGAQENTITSVLGLQRIPGWKVNLVSGPTQGPEGSLESAFIEQGGRLIVEPDLVRPVSPWQDLRAWRSLTTHFRNTRPHVVHTHSGKAGVLGRLAAARARVPLIIHTIHGPSFGSFQGPLANTLFRAAERRAGRVTRHFVCVAAAMSRQYLAAGIGQPRQYSTIYSGFDLAPFLTASEHREELRRQLGFQPGDFVVGKIARLAELKGHDDLFTVAPELVRECPGMKFLLVGDGGLRSRFERLARRPGLAGHFVFTGLVTPAQVPRYIGAMDALVHLSRREGLPRALPQALAAGKPVIAFDCDGAAEVCRTGETGFLLAPDDLSGLRQRLAELAARPALCSRLGEAGREWVRNRFSAERMVTELEELYRRLAPDHGIPCA
jgi:glycosyltransferase involved in cell wall biosynthesis